MSQSYEQQLGLPAAFPSSPQRPPKYTLYFLADRKFLGTHTFASAYAASRMLHAVINDRNYKWSSDREIELDNGITITAGTVKEMEDLVSHRDNSIERQWVLPINYQGYVRRILGGRSMDDTILSQPIADNDDPRSSGVQIPKSSTVKIAKKAPQARKLTSPGITTLAALADQLSLDPRHCRAALRKSAIDKPADGWQWSSAADIDRMTAWLKENVK